MRYLSLSFTIALVAAAPLYDIPRASGFGHAIRLTLHLRCNVIDWTMAGMLWKYSLDLRRQRMEFDSLSGRLSGLCGREYLYLRMKCLCQGCRESLKPQSDYGSKRYSGAIHNLRAICF